MSAIRADNFGNRAGTSSITADAMLQGTAKAWWNFNSTGAVAMRDSFNIASLTDNGVGAVQVNFTAAMSNANFRGSQHAASNTPGNSSGTGTIFNQTVSLFYQAQYYVSNFTGAGLTGDYPNVVGDVLGDPA